MSTELRGSRLLSLAFVAFLIAVALVGVVVARAAQQAILESQSGSIAEHTLDPTAPGFRAFTTPTPTALVLHTAVVPAQGAVLTGASLLTAGDAGAGGALVTIPSTFADPALTGDSLNSLFRSEGLDAVTNEIASSLQIGFSDVVVLDSAAWTSLMREDLPLQFTLREDLIRIEDDGSTTVLVASGTRPFDLLDIAVLAAYQNPDEPSLRLALRQQQIWQSWISQTAGADERPELFATGSGFVTIINALANGEVAYRVLPTTTVASVTDTEADTSYQPNPNEIADLISRIVPFPDVAELGDRPAVLLLDTSQGDVDQGTVTSQIVRAGAYVTIIGNAEAEAQRQTEVQLHDQRAAAQAAAIADALGTDVRFVDADDLTVSMTVLIG